MTAIHIRPFEMRDVDDVVRIHLESENAALDGWGAGVHMVADPEDAAKGWIDGPPGGAKALVAEIDGDVVAWVMVSFDKGEAELEGLYVDPSHWRRGVGSRLAREADELILQVGVAAASLWVMKDHAGARAFYESRGWTAVPERTRTVTLESVELDQLAYVKSYA